MKASGGVRLARSCGAVVLAGVVAVGVAQAAPSTKNFDATVVPTAANGLTFAVTVANDASSQQTLGSANVVVPRSGGLSLVDPGGLLPAPTGWTICVGDGTTCHAGNNVVMFRSAKGAELAKGTLVTTSVSATRNTGSCVPSTDRLSGTWAAFVKQSNDFSGTGNDFAPKTLDMNPLGSFTVQNIGTSSNGSYYVELNSQPSFRFVATAYDTCGNVKENYTGGGAYGGATLSRDPSDSLAGATVPTSLTWGSPGPGIGTSTTITATTPQVYNGLRISDASGITQRSNSFDVVDHLCQPTENPCVWTDSTGNTTVSAPHIDNGTLGVGFRNGATVTTFHCGGRTTALGSIIEIAPSSQFPDGTYTVALVFSKKVSGTGPAANFVVCLSKDNGATWGDFTAPDNGTPLQSCSTTVAPCVASQKRITGGALEVDLSLDRNDPWPGIG